MTKYESLLVEAEKHRIKAKEIDFEDYECILLVIFYIFLQSFKKQKPLKNQRFEDIFTYS